MKKNPKKIKNLLATASALAMFASGSAAHAVTVKANAHPGAAVSAINTRANFISDAGAALAADIATGDTIKFTLNNIVVNHNAAGGLTLTYDANAQAAVTIQVSEDGTATLTSSTGAAADFDLVSKVVKTFTIADVTNGARIRDINTDDFDSTYIFTKDTVVHRNIVVLNGGAGDKGTFTANGDLTVKGDVGDAVTADGAVLPAYPNVNRHVKQFNVAADKKLEFTFEGANNKVLVGKVDLKGAGSILNLNNSTATGAKFYIKEDLTTGILKTEGTKGTIAVTKAGFDLAEINLSHTGTVADSVKFTAVTDTKLMKSAVINVTGAGETTFDGALKANNINFTADGVVKFKSTVDVSGKAGVDLGDVDFGDTAGKVVITGTAATTGNIKGDFFGDDGKGILEVLSGTLLGNVGKSATARVGSLLLASGGDVVFAEKAYFKTANVQNDNKIVTFKKGFDTGTDGQFDFAKAAAGGATDGAGIIFGDNASLASIKASKFDLNAKIVDSAAAAGGGGVGGAGPGLAGGTNDTGILFAGGNTADDKSHNVSIGQTGTDIAAVAAGYDDTKNNFVGDIKSKGFHLLGKGEVTLNGILTGDLKYDDAGIGAPPAVVAGGAVNDKAGNFTLRGGKIDGLVNLKGDKAAVFTMNAGEVTGDIKASHADQKININGGKLSSITSNGLNLGTVTFGGKADIEVTKHVGDALLANRVNKTIFDTTKTVLIKGDGLASEEILFKQDGTLNLETGKISAATIKVATDNIGTILSNKNQTLNVAIGEDKKSLKLVKLVGDHTVTIESKKDMYVKDFLPGTDVQSKIILEGSVVFGNIGGEKASFEEVTLGSVGKATVKGFVYARDVKVGTSDLTFGKGVVSGNGINFNGNNVVLTFEDGALLNAITYNNAKSGGAIVFAGGANISKDVGTVGSNLLSVNFAGSGKVINVKSVYADSVVTGKNTLRLSGNTTFSGRTIADFSKSTLDLNKHRLTVDGPITFSATTLNVVRDGGVNGIISNKGSIKAQDLSDLSVNVTLAGNTLQKANSFTVFENAANISKLPVDANVKSSNSFYKFTVKRDTASSLVLNTQRDKKLQDVITGKSNELAKFFESQFDKVDANSKGGKFLAKLLNSTDAEAAAILAPELGSIQRTAGIIGAISGLQETVEAHGTVTTTTTTALNTTRVLEESGVAAGSMSDRVGTWVKGFMGRSNQDTKSGASAGYKGELSGITVGFDTYGNDKLVMGAAATFANNVLKHKDYLSGSKTNARSSLLSVYGMYYFNPEIFSKISLGFGNTKVTNTAKKYAGTASGKYDVGYYGLSGSVGYNYTMADQFVVTPSLGLSYDKFQQGGYTETGVEYAQKVSKQHIDSLVGKLGLSVSGTVDTGDYLVISPEAHVGVNHKILGKKAVHQFTYEGFEGTYSAKGAQPSATWYNAGMMLTAKNGSIEYGVGLDANFKSGYNSQKGTIKLKVNF